MSNAPEKTTDIRPYWFAGGRRKNGICLTPEPVLIGPVQRWPDIVRAVCDY
jgi:hypothetical protein